MPIDQTLFELTKAVVSDAITRILQRVRDGAGVGQIVSWHKVNHWDNGLPHFIRSNEAAPDDYAGMFGWQTWQSLKYEELDGAEPLYQYVKATSGLGKLRNQLPVDHIQDVELRAKIERSSVQHFVLSLVDRCLQMFGLVTCEREQLLAIYEPLEAYLFLEELRFDVLVPILCMRFDFDELELGKGRRIERISPDLQLARANLSSEIWHEPLVAGLATHALVIPDHTARNDGKSLWETRSYPLEEIDEMFGVLRVLTGADTGYAQLIAIPKGWAREYTATLPSIEGVSMRWYPAAFHEYRWLGTAHLVSADAAPSLRQLFENARKVNNRRWRLALRRLNRCLVRDDADDALLDAVIGLEALFSDSEKEALTHKLAFRLSVLAAFKGVNAKDPMELFHAVKKTYSARSKIVHEGSASTQSINVFGATCSPSEAAVVFLRFALQRLAESPEYLDPKNIDALALERVAPQRD